MSTMTVLQFDGDNDYVDLGVPSWTYSTNFRTTMTAECWFKTTDISNHKTTAALIGRNKTGSGQSAESQFSLYMQSTGEIGFGLTNTGNTESYHATATSYKDALCHQPPRVFL